MTGKETNTHVNTFWLWEEEIHLYCNEYFIVRFLICAVRSTEIMPTIEDLGAEGEVADVLAAADPAAKPQSLVGLEEDEDDEVRK